ncbi:thiamine-phosphate kinase [Marinobacter salinisoli]|uniref:Thiamine-monophosphate kinase n=1 Tax=Marinobacter salinisoli TaxID=2769486 RepID=A0ABX7MVR9_9GAMM|nr:thiamine-phosphate kinase [Marinobacter salinisoli]QSP96495.1 thiamine-phosphate kinase [Marinobacter salinisoli]
MGEFELIRRYFQPMAARLATPCLVLGPGDDCAIQRVPAGNDLVFSVDTLVEGVHFPEAYPSRILAWRALAAAASDLAAMGAHPVCFTLAMTLPEADEDWLSGFAEGLADAAANFGLALAGGDTTRGPLVLTIQVHGTVPEGRGLLRSGAEADDLVCVSGCLGDAGAALEYLTVSNPEDDVQSVLQRYHQPQPRLELGHQLIDVASSAIDISDGLKADLGHILAASGVGATIRAADIPVSSPLARLKGQQAVSYALHSGDDYELCVTLSPENWGRLPPNIRNQLTVIGVVEREPGLRIQGWQGAAGSNGFDHFRSMS